MFIKIYSYHIQKDKTEEFLNIQEMAGEIYNKYIDSQTTYLQSNEDDTKWMEITTYNSEDEYNRSINMVNNNIEIQKLFKLFESVLVEGKNIVEENFNEVQLLKGRTSYGERRV